MFISSQESSHRLKLLQYNTNGVMIKGSINNPGYKVYNIKIHEHLRLEDDPKVHCRNYHNPKDYAEVQNYISIIITIALPITLFQCLDEDFENQFMNAMNCSPPYITEKKNLWCREAVNMSPGAASLVSKFSDGRKQSERCLPPCKVTR